VALFSTATLQCTESIKISCLAVKHVVYGDICMPLQQPTQITWLNISSGSPHNICMVECDFVAALGLRRGIDRLLESTRLSRR
jgi:hypothetical protein